MKKSVLFFLFLFFLFPVFAEVSFKFTYSIGAAFSAFEQNNENSDLYKTAFDNQMQFAVDFYKGLGIIVNGELINWNISSASQNIKVRFADFSFGLEYNIPISENWEITPQLFAGMGFPISQTVSDKSTHYAHGFLAGARIPVSYNFSELWAFSVTPQFLYHWFYKPISLSAGIRVAF